METPEITEALDVLDKSKSILDRTYTALGRTQEYRTTNTTTSYFFKILPNEQFGAVQVQPAVVPPAQRN